MVRILRGAGLSVEPHDSHFGPRTDDHVWLGECARRGWVPLTKDDQIRYNTLAKKVIMENGVHLFVCIGSWPHERLALNVVHSIGRIRALHARETGAFIARLYMVTDDGLFKKGRSGEVKVWLSEVDWLKSRGRGGAGRK